MKIEEGFADLHRGLYAQAERKFRDAASTAPGDPEPQYCIAYSRWWQLLLNSPEVNDDDAAFDTAIDATIEKGRQRLAANSRDAHAMAAAGGAHVLRSHIEARRKKFFRSASAARRGKKLLEAALAIEPDLETALFPFGAFNYYADNVPLIVKGIRALLFIPGGDRDLGLRQIERVAEGDGPLRTDARMLLAKICGSPDELAYEGAIEHLRRALEDHPGSPLIAGAIGGLYMRLGRYGEAERIFASGLNGAAGDDPERERQRRRLRIAMAEAAIADWRLARGEELLRLAEEEPGEMTSAQARARGRVEHELREKRGTIPGDPGNADGAEALRRFLRGRSLFIEERFAEALAELRAAGELAVDPHPWMEGWIELYSGLAESRGGNEREARAHFRRASQVRRFRSSELGLLKLAGETETHPVCSP